MRSTPISIIEQRSAGVEKFPLDVIQKWLENVSRNFSGLLPGSENPLLLRQMEKGIDSPMCPRMIFRFGYSWNIPLRTIRIAWVAVSTVKPQPADCKPG